MKYFLNPRLVILFMLFLLPY